jgi:small-conductance mechanosensitive channel
VTISNASVFDEPVYNYTREFPYLWEEMRVPIAYSADHGRVERLMVDVVNKHTHEIQQVSDSDKRELERRYMTAPLDTRPTVYYRMTDNWVELTIRFLVKEHGIRELKDAITRDLLTGLNEAGIGIASTTFEIVGLPPLRLAPIAPVTPTAAQ